MQANKHTQVSLAASFRAAQSVMREFKMNSVNRVAVLVMMADHEKAKGYCSAKQIQREIRRGSSAFVLWLEKNGYIERTGVHAKPRRLTPAGHRVIDSLHAHYARILAQQTAKRKPASRTLAQIKK